MPSREEEEEGRWGEERRRRRRREEEGERGGFEREEWSGNHKIVAVSVNEFTAPPPLLGHFVTFFYGA